MNHADFTFHMKRMVDCYGEKSYPDVRVQQIWEWAKRMEPRVFSEIVAKLIGDCDRPPLLQKFQEYYSIVRQKMPRQKIDCGFCDGGGFICDDKPLPTAYACRCEAGQEIPDYVLRWQGPWVRVVPTQAEINWARSAAIISETMVAKKIDV